VLENWKSPARFWRALDQLPHRVALALLVAMRVALLLFVAVSQVGASEVSPVEKVVTMMEDLQTQVVTEGKSEATTYDKFACFCKDMSNEKNEAITEAQDSISTLTASINQLTSDREDLDSDIAEYNSQIELLTKQMREATATRAEQKATYDKEKAELTKGKGDVDNAVEEMKASSAPSLISIQSVLKTVRQAVLMADALGQGPKNKQLLTDLLQQAPGVPMDSYEGGRAGGIVETIEGLSEDFIGKLAEIKSVEVQRIAEFDLYTQGKHDTKLATEKDLKDAQELKDQKMEKIAQDQQALTATNAQMTDDQAYIKDLTDKCDLKSRQWAQRSQMRSEELTALSTAITIVKGRVADHTSDKTVRLVQKSVTPVQASSAQNDEEVDDIVGAESFLQIASPRASLSLLQKGGSHSPDSDTARARVVALLRAKSTQLDSAVLAALASHVAADPFAKIKTLIQELIERLLQEAADEANHKGWCDKEIGKAKQSRKLKAEAVASLNTQLADNEAKRDQLAEDTTRLGTEIDELEESLATLTKERHDESAQNEATVSEAEEGKAAVEEALEVLDHFYKTAAKAEKVELLQQAPPDAGFDSGSQGSQSASKGIIGMLEVIQSDFVRTIETTQKVEREAAADFLELETTTKVSMGKKTMEKDNKQATLVETNDAIREDNESMLDEQALLDKSIQELNELRPACIDTGMSYEDRVAKREQEIDSLKEALCTLDTMGPVQTEGC